jgi:two-component system cell cycle sensor histidine kinase/response regulator CckA
VQVSDAFKDEQEEGEHGVRAPGGGRRVVYIDDDEAMVFLVKRMLDRQGYVVNGFTDSAKAMEALRRDAGAFSLVVTDYNMPGMSGLEVTRTIRGIRADLPVAIVSGYIDEELVAQAKGAGARELIAKTSVGAEFIKSIQRLIESPALPPMHS